MGDLDMFLNDKMGELNKMTSAQRDDIRISMKIHGFVVKVIGNKIRNIVIRRARKHVIILIIC